MDPRTSRTCGDDTPARDPRRPGRPGPTEFVEIVNVSTERDRLRNVALVFVNGATSAEYRRVQLSGGLGPSRKLVVGTGTVSVDGSARVLWLPLAQNNIQNGAPDGVVLLDTADGTVIDALSYEGSIDQAQILCRLPTARI